MLDLGPSCNSNCIFCFVAKERADMTTREAMVQLSSSRSSGASEVVLTGGEPTIRKDIFEIISCAKSLGYRLIQLQTNARMLSYPEFAERLIKAGVNEVVPAIHGHTAKVHDYLVRSKGAFVQAIKGIKNVVDKGVYILTDTVIVKQNYKFLPDITKFLYDLGVDQVQLSFVHPLENALRNFDVVVPRISAVQEPLRSSIDIAHELGKPLTVEGVPFCFLRGAESHAVETHLPQTEVRDREHTDEDLAKIRKNEEKTKGPRCRNCKYNPICEGIWKEYAEKFGFEELVPVVGEPITSPDVFLYKRP
jgi:MoaA/NifB/PqqE/SkfB family radical SAM enzyme